MPKFRFRARLLAVAAASLTFGAAAHAQDRAEETAEVEEIVVQATRSTRLLQDQPIRVEVISREEIEEKVLMTPGNISTLVAETGGVRVQVTSPALGAAGIRMQGMRGRYTQLLADGLPIFGGQTSSLGLLQIPPSDLGRVEVIKGAASALYGPSALGGVINLVSRRPRTEPDLDFLLNTTSRYGQDATAYAARRAGAMGYSITGGLHRQSGQDLDADGWLDMPAFERWTLRPRVFWDGEGGASVYATVGLMGEQRGGGTLPGRITPDGSPFRQGQDTRRLDAGLLVEAPVGPGLLQLRGAAVSQDHDHRYGAVLEDDRHRTFLAEASLAGRTGVTSWLAGVAVQRDDYRNRTFAAFDNGYTVPAVFGQVEHDLAEGLTLAGSLRWDAHSDYGDRLSPRVSLLYRPGPWTFRASVGRGFHAPTPFVEEIEAAGLSRLIPPTGLQAETAETGSLEAGYSSRRFEANVSLFGSVIHDAVQIEVANATPGAERVRLVNAVGDTRASGAEVLLRYRWREMVFTGSYVYVHASEPDPSGGQRITPVTPRHTAGLVAMWENHDKGRVGLEVYYTGTQALDGNPYRTKGRPYLEVGLLAERVVGRARLFVNLENILDVRQTKYDPILLPVRGPAGEGTVDAWSPAEGFVVNGGIKLRFGGE